jgi:hypothetical protein
MLAPLGNAKNKKANADPKDEIEVVGHIALTSGAVNRFITTQHYSSYYLYAEHPDGKLTLIDVTNTSQPAVLADVAYAPDGGPGSLSAVTGTAALVSSQPPSPGAAPQQQTIKIMDLADPKNPKVAREFAGVTAVSKDAGRGLIFLANSEGVWILRQHFAEDPEVQRAYEDYVIYGPSMYPPRR